MEDILPTVRLTEEQVWNDYHEVLAANGWTVEAFEAIDDAGCSCCTPLRVIDADIDDEFGVWNWVDQAQQCRFLLGRDGNG